MSLFRGETSVTRFCVHWEADKLVDTLRFVFFADRVMKHTTTMASLLIKPLRR
ncbi:MAG: DUF3083 family protein [Pseudomonadales bacterium]|nr:DUF3083 family protein [Pseudomonadales bacterium]